MRYAHPGEEGALVQFKARYDHYIGGVWVPPVKGQYFANITPVTGEPFCEVARGTAQDIERALDAAHQAFPVWGKTAPQKRAEVLLAMADRNAAKLGKTSDR